MADPVIEFEEDLDAELNPGADSAELDDAFDEDDETPANGGVEDDGGAGDGAAEVSVQDKTGDAAPPAPGKAAADAAGTREKEDPAPVKAKPAVRAPVVAEELSRPAELVKFEAGKAAAFLRERLGDTEYDDPTADGGKIKASALFDDYPALMNVMADGMARMVEHVVGPAVVQQQALAQEFSQRAVQTAAEQQMAELEAAGHTDVRELVSNPELWTWADEHPAMGALLDSTDPEEVAIALDRFRAVNGLEAPAAGQAQPARKPGRGAVQRAAAAAESALHAGTVRERTGRFAARPKPGSPEDLDAAFNEDDDDDD